VSPGAVSGEGLEQLCTLRIRRPQTFLIGRNSDMYPRRLGCTCTRGSILLGGQSQGTAPPAAIKPAVSRLRGIQFFGLVFSSPGNEEHFG
jgi:hypothetical protein